ncbi:MAG: S-layer homology domain-containing protein, partial [Oscillospiraceae bacterium]|nr:S-layer homology domain-containing protein [Oscillospiraceae bacterium]
MKKRLISLLLVCCMLVTMLPVTALAEAAPRTLTKGIEAAPTNPFHDVKTSDWYHDAVLYVYANNLFTGVSDTEFNPNGTMTRGMFVTVLGRLAGVDAKLYSGQSQFDDVSAKDYFAPYVAWAAKHGITTGTGNGKFSPNALINRQQMAAFFARYFEVFNIQYNVSGNDTEKPADFSQVDDWAKDGVELMWQTGLLVGDGVNFNPTAQATRAQAATICQRLDEAVETWYCEPGQPSEREQLDAETGESDESGRAILHYTVSFYDGDRLIDELTANAGYPLGKLPSVEKSSKEGAVLVGYYYDPEFTQPFHADRLVRENLDVFAKYQEIEKQEVLMARTFTQLDQDPDLSFCVERQTNPTAGEVDVDKLAATVRSVDGSEPVKLSAEDNDDGTYTLYAEDGWNEGCSYELTLADGWVFTGKETTIRTASFTIFMEEVENIRMGDGIIYIEDTPDMDYEIDGICHEILTAAVANGLDEEDEIGMFNYGEDELAVGDILCIYAGIDPRERDNNNGSHAMMPAVYVQVCDVDGDVVEFSALDKSAQQGLYEIPDNFPLRVDALPDAPEGVFASVDELIDLLDEPTYMSVFGEDEGSCEAALPRVS